MLHRSIAVGFDACRVFCVLIIQCIRYFDLVFFCRIHQNGELLVQAVTGYDIIKNNE